MEELGFGRLGDQDDDEEGWSSASEGEHEMWIRSAMHECKNKPLNVDPRYEIDEALRTYNPVYFQEGAQRKQELPGSETPGGAPLPSRSHTEKQLEDDGNPFSIDLVECGGDPFGTVREGGPDEEAEGVGEIVSATADLALTPPKPEPKPCSKRSGSRRALRTKQTSAGSPSGPVSAVVDEPAPAASPRRSSSSCATKKKPKRTVPGFMRDTLAWTKRMCVEVPSKSHKETKGKKTKRTGHHHQKPVPTRRQHGRSIQDILNVADERLCAPFSIGTKSAKSTHVSSSVAGRAIFRRSKMRRRKQSVSQSIVTTKSSSTGWLPPAQPVAPRKPAVSTNEATFHDAAPLFTNTGEPDRLTAKEAATLRAKQRQRLQKRRPGRVGWPSPGSHPAIQQSPVAVASPTLKAGAFRSSDVDLDYSCLNDGEQDLPLMAAPDHSEDDDQPLERKIDQLRNALSSVSLMYETQVSELRKKLGTSQQNSQKKEKKIAKLKKKLGKGTSRR